MIKAISVENYKGFEKATIDLKPITLFLGENSAGKTSLIQLLLMLSQTALPSRFKDKSPLDLHGHFAKMGPIEHLFRDKDIGKPFRISIKFSHSEFFYWPTMWLRQYVRTIYRIVGSTRLAGVDSLLFQRDKKGDYLKLREEDLMEPRVFSRFINDFINIISKPIGQDYLKKTDLLSAMGTGVSIKDFFNPSVSDFTSVHKMLSRLKEAYNQNSEFTVTYQFSYKDNKIIISEVKITMNQTELFNLATNNPEYEFKSDLIKDVDFARNHIDAIQDCFLPNNSIFSCFEYPFEDYNTQKSNETTLSNYFLRIAQQVLGQLKEELDLNQVNHVGPLRAAPKHYYVLDKDHYLDYFDCSDPETVVQILKNNQVTVDFVNKWLKDFGFSVGVSQSKEEMINHIEVDQDGNTLNIPEVGFGISQILPILLQCHISEPDSLTMIEQPEIHLHPKMQANLANLFAEVIADKSKNLIIESHSEYMLRRLRRLMSEGKIINPDYIAIYYFERKDKENGRDSISVRELKIGEKGDFDWPGDFYLTEMEDNIEFLKNQTK